MTQVEQPLAAVERANTFTDDDLAALCEAADAAIIDGGGFGWVTPPGRLALERYFRGLLLVPERELFVCRLDGVLVGSVQLVRPPRNNEAQAFAATLTHSFIAPYARGHGLAKMMTLRAEDGARALGALGVAEANVDPRELVEHRAELGRPQPRDVRRERMAGVELVLLDPAHARAVDPV